MVGNRKRLLAPVCAALAASILITSSVAAAHTWSDPTTLWAHDQTQSSAAFPGGLVSLDGTNVVSAYVRTTNGGSPEVFVRRSTDGGASWAAPAQISRPGTGSWRVSLAGGGMDVDAVITESGGATTEPGIQYTHSTDGGVTFSPPVLVSGGGIAYIAHVARGPNGTVAIVWYSKQKARIFVRVSHDGGATFARRVTLWQGSPYASGGQAIAVSAAGIYVASGSLKHGIEIRHSTDGVAWSDRVRLDGFDSSGTGDQLTLAADGAEAYVGYVRHNRHGLASSYRHTSDGGLTWSARAKLGAPTGSVSAPMFMVAAGLTRAAFSTSDCGSNCSLALFYRESADGVAWSPRELVAPAWSVPMGIGYSGQVVIAYSHYVGNQVGYDLEVRTGTN
jgi:hypothetical protein